MTNLTVDGLKAFAAKESNKRLAYEYLALKAKAQVIRQQVNAIYKPIFDRYTFMDDEGEQIAFEDDRLYCCDDDDLLMKYWEECHVALLAAGFEPKEVGHCPALTAEHQQRMKGVEIIGVQAAFMGIETPYDLEIQDKMLEMFLQVTLGKLV